MSLTKYPQHSKYKNKKITGIKNAYTIKSQSVNIDPKSPYFNFACLKHALLPSLKTVFFASIGGVVFLFISGEYLSVPASVGFIALWGIAVLNGVVLVSYIRNLRDNGLSQLQAIRQGCAQCFRPAMMTATVALLGLVPFLFTTGPDSEVQRPLAIVVIGGLITSTLLTLIMLPALYRWLEENREPI